MAGKKYSQRRSRNPENAQPQAQEQVRIDVRSPKREHRKDLSAEIRDQYLGEFRDLVESEPSLQFLRKRVDALGVQFELKELASCYRLALGTYRDLHEKQTAEVREAKRDQEKIKLRMRLLSEELMLPRKGAECKELAVKEEEKSHEKAALEEYERSYQRLKMDFDNFRRRTNQHIEQLTHTANERLIVKLLPFLDSLDRAIAAIPTDSSIDPYRQGLILIKKQLEETLEKEGLFPIDAREARFDPKYHEAFTYHETDTVPDGTVIEEIRRGYRIGEKVIRPSLVKVAKALGNAGNAPSELPPPQPEGPGFGEPIDGLEL